MVRLTTITTKTGDRGETGLGDGSKVSKTHPRIEALGTIDELNASLGLTLALGGETSYRVWLRQIQNDLFDLGADLCFPWNSEETERTFCLQEVHLQRLDQWLEELQPLLPALESFILPGGAALPASLHWTRTVCRRAERTVLQLAESEPVPPLSISYLNRLSDLFFQLARATDDPETPAPLWRPSPH